jgi:hypothetical protein
MIHNHLLLFIGICTAAYVVIAGCTHGVGEAIDAELEIDGDEVPWDIVSGLWPVFLLWMIVKYAGLAIYYTFYYTVALVSQGMNAATKRLTGRKRPLPKVTVVRKEAA